MSLHHGGGKEKARVRNQGMLPIYPPWKMPAQEIKICGVNQEQTRIWASTRYHTPSHCLQDRLEKLNPSIIIT